MTSDAIAIVLTLGFTTGLTIFSIFMFFFAMTPPMGSSGFTPSPYQPMDILVARQKGAKKKAPARERHDENEWRKAA